jgi:23S rRNA pseudouridine2605 synthase
MPPRFAYWTIILEGKPTAFRAQDREELLPTMRQLQVRHPDVVMMWFSRGRLWNSPEEAQAAERRGSERRKPDWRPGGEHRDPRARFAIPRDEKRRRFAAKLRRDRDDTAAGGPDARNRRPPGERHGRDEWRDRGRQKPHPARTPQDRDAKSGAPRSRPWAPGWQERPARHTDRPGKAVRPPGGSRGTSGSAEDQRGTRPEGKPRPPRAPGGRPQGSAGGRTPTDRPAWKPGPPERSGKPFGKGRGGGRPGGGRPGGRESGWSDSPGGDRPGGGRPFGDRPGAARPGGARPGGLGPQAHRPGSGRPGGGRPGGGRPAGGRPGHSRRGGGKPGGGRG